MKETSKPTKPSLMSYISAIKKGATVKFTGYSIFSVRAVCTRLRKEGKGMTTTSRNGAVYVTRID